MDVAIDNTWKTVLSDEFEKEYFQKLSAEVKADYLLHEPPIYPPAPLVFNAFNLCPLTQVKVVILGQDPYHGPNQAMGLAFSVPEAATTPPSLKNIYKEIEADIGSVTDISGDLTHWTKQGVLLLNATLTVAHKQPGSHQGRGWEQFTDRVIETISKEKEHVVFLLWGKYAQAKEDLIDTNKHLVLKAPHPSPFSAHSGFFGCQHFSQTNEYLKQHNQQPIKW